MPSPFPGMDPYLEEPSLWPDFHLGMIAAMRVALASQLPEQYAVFADRCVWLHEPDADTRRRLGKPNVFVSERIVNTPQAGSVVAVQAPVRTVLPVVRRQGERYLRIIDRQDRRVVTVIELLSPTNKDASLDRDAYLAKRYEYMATGTNVVEIDLLRAGPRLPTGSPQPPPADYYVAISEAGDFPNLGVWPFTVRDALPTLLVPLSAGDQPVSLDLQGCFQKTYDEFRYDRELNYAAPPTPPLREPEASWARELLASRPR